MMNLTPFDVLVLAMATCYWAFAITKTHGPFGIFEKTRTKVTFGGLLKCPVCAAFWIAVAFYTLLQTPLRPLVEVSAVAGGATLLGFYTGTWQQ